MPTRADRLRTVAGRTDTVVIVGAGLGGLSAALFLAAAGREVTVVERESVPGGRCGLFEADGYRFDTGPTVLTAPDLLARPLRAVGEELPDWLTLRRLDPAYRARFADGSTIDVRADAGDMAEEIARTCGRRDADGWLRYVAFLRELYRVEMPHVHRPQPRFPDATAWPLAAAACLAGRIPTAAASSATTCRMTDCDGCSRSRRCTRVWLRRRRSRSTL